VLHSALVLVPVAPILAARLAAHLLFGRPLLETLNAQGLAALAWRPRAFATAVGLRQRCEGAATAGLKWRQPSIMAPPHGPT
jgi:hypothetical protein